MIIRQVDADLHNDEGFDDELTEPTYMAAIEDHEVPGHEFQPDIYNEFSPALRQPVNPQVQQQLKKLYRVMEQVDKKAYQLNVAGYNSSKYDLNVLAKYLLPLMEDAGMHAVKRNNRYLLLSNNKFRFTDIYLFMAPTTSLDSFAKSYMRREDYDNVKYAHKGVFPYEFLSSVHVLEQTVMPGPEFFTTTSRKTYLECADDQRKQKLHQAAVEKHNLAVQAFQAYGCRTMRDYLIVYNKSDVAPGVRAIQNLCQIYRDSEKLDLFDCLTLPSMAKQIALQNTPIGGHFMRFQKEHEEWYHLTRRAIVGGQSIVSLRLAVAGLTKIREPEFGSAAKTVQRVVGIDMSGCYLWATAQQHLTGPYFVRNGNNGFKIENGLRNVNSVLAIEHCVFNRFGGLGLELLQHQFRGGERHIQIPDGPTYHVDGYLQLPDGTTYIIEFHGCYFHNHIVGCTIDHAYNFKHNLRRELERQEQLQEVVTEVVVIRECEWLSMRSDQSVQQFLPTRPLFHTWQKRFGIRETDVLPLIMQDKLTGLFEVDAYVPKNKRAEFRDVQPFYCQMDITFDMIGDNMRRQMIAAKRQFTSRRLLVNPPFCQKQMLTHFYIKWLVERGIVIHKVYRILEFPLCSAPFATICNKICDQRQRAASANASEEEMARGTTCKLNGNAIYGQFCMQPDTHTVTKYGSEEQLIKCTNLQRMCNVNKLGDDLFELTYAKPVVTVKQCPQMAVGVYQHAKLRMTAFDYDFSRIMDRALYSLILTDTDSYYYALAKRTWQECVRPDVTLGELLAFQKKYFCMSDAESKKMGLFHVEFDGHSLAALQPKMYCAVSEKGNKTATRGIGRRETTLGFDEFINVLKADNSAAQESSIVQRVFRIVNNRMTTVRAPTKAFNSFYIKRKVIDNNIDTADLDWYWPPEFNQ